MPTAAGQGSPLHARPAHDRARRSGEQGSRGPKAADRGGGRWHAHIRLTTPSPCAALSQDKAQVLSDVRAIIAEQLGTDLEKVRRCRRLWAVSRPFGVLRPLLAGSAGSSLPDGCRGAGLASRNAPDQLGEPPRQSGAQPARPNSAPPVAVNPVKRQPRAPRPAQTQTRGAGRCQSRGRAVSSQQLAADWANPRNPIKVHSRAAAGAPQQPVPAC